MSQNIWSVYKVVRHSWNGELVSVNRVWVYTYRVDVWSRGVRPCMAFDTLGNARLFVEDNSRMWTNPVAIYEALGTSRRYVKEVVKGMQMSRSNIKEFWREPRANLGRFLPDWSLMIAPPGTVACDRLKLVRHVIQYDAYAENQRIIIEHA